MSRNLGCCNMLRSILLVAANSVRANSPADQYAHLYDDVAGEERRHELEALSHPLQGQGGRSVQLLGAERRNDDGGGRRGHKHAVVRTIQPGRNNCNTDSCRASCSAMPTDRKAMAGSRYALEAFGKRGRGQPSRRLV